MRLATYYSHSAWLRGPSHITRPTAALLRREAEARGATAQKQLEPGALPAKVQEACLGQSMIGLYSEENTAHVRDAVTEHPTLTGKRPIKYRQINYRQIKEDRNDKERLRPVVCKGKMSQVTRRLLPLAVARASLPLDGLRAQEWTEVGEKLSQLV